MRVPNIADELTIVAPPNQVDHSDIGIHFERFDGRRYVPNAEKRAHFPDDDDAAAQLLLQ